MLKQLVAPGRMKFSFLQELQKINPAFLAVTGTDILDNDDWVPLSEKVGWYNDLRGDIASA